MNKNRRVLLAMLFLCLPFVLNCGGGGGGGSSGGVVVPGLTGEQLISDGWSNVQTGNYSQAETYFQNALSQGLSETQKVAANSGLGWAKTLGGKALESITSFEQASPADKEASVGLAGALMARNGSGDLARAKQLLLAVSGSSFTDAHEGLGLDSARIAALTAIACALSGDGATAKTSIAQAVASRDSASESAVNQVSEGFKVLGWSE